MRNTRMFGSRSEARAEPLTLKAAQQKRTDKTQRLISVTLTYTPTTFLRDRHITIMQATPTHLELYNPKS
jgi:hypothetical protein